MTTNLVVADKSRTEKTICLAVTPALKKHGIPGRPRLFQAVQKVKEANAARLRKTPNGIFTGESCDAKELDENPSLAIAYLVAPPRMGLYMRYSTQIYNIYLRYIAPEDIHVYSIDEVMISAGSYLKTYHMTARELAVKMILGIEKETGITATAGIGSNLYLSKIAMDIGAKHAEPDEHGVRIAELDEMSYRRSLWSHRPLTDFWRVGRGYAKKLEAHGLYTMGDIARCSIGKPEDYYNEDLLYKLFGINADLLIDHAWGYEPCKIEDIKGYRPENNSVGSGQVLTCPYEWDKARLVVREMADNLALDLVNKGLVSDQMILTVGYDIENLTDPERRKQYKGEVTIDVYGRKIPKHAHGTIHLDRQTSSAKLITDAVMELFDQIVDKTLLVRRMNLVAGKVALEADMKKTAETYEQLNLFTDYLALQEKQEAEKKSLEKERKMQQAMIDIKKKFGKNAILKGMNLEEGATMKERNRQIGGHRE
jgi:DNA polymerase V